MIKGNDKKGKRRKGGRRMKGFIIAQKRQERTVMTINLSKGRKTRLRSYSVQISYGQMINYFNEDKRKFRLSPIGREKERIQVCFQPQ